MLRTSLCPTLVFGPRVESYRIPTSARSWPDPHTTTPQEPRPLGFSAPQTDFCTSVARFSSLSFFSPSFLVSSHYFFVIFGSQTRESVYPSLQGPVNGSIHVHVHLRQEFDAARGFEAWFMYGSVMYTCRTLYSSW